MGGHQCGQELNQSKMFNGAIETASINVEG